MSKKTNETNVVQGYFGGTPYRELEQLHMDFDAVLEEYSGKVSIAGVIGVLEIMKAELIREGLEEE